MNQINIMARSVTSVTTGEYFTVNFTPGICVYLHETRSALNHSYFESVSRLFRGIFIMLVFPYPLIYHILELLLGGHTRDFILF